MSHGSSPVSPHPILPPIIQNERDRTFIRDIRDFVETEKDRLPERNAKQDYVIYKDVFDQVLEHSQAYGPLLLAVKTEYERLIEAIERGHQEAGYLDTQIKTMSSEPSTLDNYRRRADELARKTKIVKMDNERLSKQIKDMREKREKTEEEEKKKREPPKRIVKKDKRSIQGLTLEESTDAKVLQGELFKVEAQLKELGADKQTKFHARSSKDELKERLTRKVEERDLLQQTNNWLRARQRRLKVAMDAAVAYNTTDPQYKTIGDVVLLAMAKHRYTDEKMGPREGPSGTDLMQEDDDPSKEKETELVVEYIDKFNELFDNEHYEEAAIHAANSPKGILRSMDTMQKFKAVSARSEGRSPWLAFCDAIMSSVLALGIKPTETMSMECVQCALTENRLDLLTHWITQDRLSITEGLGDMIVAHCEGGKNRDYLALAESIYHRCYAHIKAIECMVRQGRCRRAVEWAREKAQFTSHEYLDLVKKYPIPQLAYALVDPTLTSDNQGLLSVGVVTRALMETIMFESGLHVLQELMHKEAAGDNQNYLRQAIINDEITTTEQWNEVVKCCQENGYDDIAIEILASVTVKRSVKWSASAGGRGVSDVSEKSLEPELNFSSGTASSAN